MNKHPSKKYVKSNIEKVHNAKRFYDIRRGLNQVVDGIRPAYGPHPDGYAGNNPSVVKKQPAIFGSHHSEIPHRPSRYEEYGAQFAQNTIKDMDERLNDGTSTMALMFQSIYNQSVNYLARTGNARWLQYHLYDGIKTINQELLKLSEPVSDRQGIMNIALSTCHEEKLATLLAEIFDFIGPFGSLDINKSEDSPRILKREYIQGSNWNASYFRIPRDHNSPENLNSLKHALYQLEDASILVSNFVINDVAAIHTFIDKVKAADISSIVFIAEDISADVLRFIYQQNADDDEFTIVPVNTPGTNIFEKDEMLKLIALLTDAKPLLASSGYTPDNINIEDLGQARRIWVGKSKFGIIGGKSDPRKVKSHIQMLTRIYDKTADPGLRKRIRQQLGKLMNGHAAITIDGETHFDVGIRMALASQAAATIRNAIRYGAVPGGGAALLDCRDILFQKMEENINIDKKAANRILLRAIEEPSRVLIAGAGFNPQKILLQIRHLGSGYCFDVRQKSIVNSREAGIMDSTLVLTEAVRTAIHYAVVGLTADPVVTKRPPINDYIDTFSH